jgi:hypothetical protein
MLAVGLAYEYHRLAPLIRGGVSSAASGELT